MMYSIHERIQKNFHFYLRKLLLCLRYWHMLYSIHDIRVLRCSYHFHNLLLLLMLKTEIKFIINNLFSTVRTVIDQESSNMGLHCLNAMLAVSARLAQWLPPRVGLVSHCQELAVVAVLTE